MAYALIWRAATESLKPVPEVLFSLGVATLSAVVLILTGIDFFLDSTVAVLGIPLASYVVALAMISRKERVHPALVVFCGIVGLAPLWWLLGFALVGTACGMAATGGC
jgi:hypothetical protein